MAYVSLSNVIKSTGNRATVDYVDNAINASLGKIANAVGSNNINADSIVSLIQEQGGSAPDWCYYYDADGSRFIYINNKQKNLSNLFRNTTWIRSPYNIPFPNNVDNLAFAFYNTSIFIPQSSSSSEPLNTSLVAGIPKTVKNLYKAFGDISFSEYGGPYAKGATFIFYGYNNLTDVNFFLSSNKYNNYAYNNLDYSFSRMVSYVGEGGAANNCYTNHIGGIANLDTTNKWYYVSSSNTSSIAGERVNSQYPGIEFRKVRYCNSFIEGIRLDNGNSRQLRLTSDTSDPYFYDTNNFTSGIVNFSYDIRDLNLDSGVWPLFSKNVKNISNFMNYMHFNNKNNNILIDIRGALPFGFEDPNSIIDMAWAYNAAGNSIYGRVPDTPNVKNAQCAYQNCRLITGEFPNVHLATNLFRCFDGCASLVGQASNMDSTNANMSWAYYCCENLYYAPDHIKSAPDMSACFFRCENLRTVCVANDTINMKSCFYDCERLKYSYISDSVEDGASAYQSCKRLLNFSFGNNLINCQDMYDTAGVYFYGKEIPDTFIYASNINDARNCFYNAGMRNYFGSYKRLNLHLLANTKTNNSFNSSIVGNNYPFITDVNNNCRYNIFRNIYIYWHTLDEMKKLDTANWYSNGVHK